HGRPAYSWSTLPRCPMLRTRTVSLASHSRQRIRSSRQPYRPNLLLPKRLAKAHPQPCRCAPRGNPESHAVPADQAPSGPPPLPRHSILQAKLPAHLSAAEGLAVLLQPLLCQIAVLQVLDVFFDQFGGVRGSCLPGLPRQSLLERRFQSNRKHGFYSSVCM